jgi:Right handed beta helix region
VASPCAVRPAVALALAGVLMLTGCSTGAAPAPPTSAPVVHPASSITTRAATYRVPGWWRPKAPTHPNRGGRRFSNFHAAAGTLDGLVLAGNRLVGRGVGRAVLRMRPHTSTHASDVPSRFPQTNQLSLVRLQSTVREFAGFTIKATEQGHLYNGLRVDRAGHFRMHDVRIAGIPGSASAPPGETFGLNDYRTSGARYTRVEIDGAGRGASGFGVNGSRNITVRRSYSHDNRHSMGFAFWHVRNITITQSLATNNGGAGFNFERVSGSVRLSGIVALRNRYPISIASDQGSATYRIVDPTFPGRTLEVHLPRTYYGVKNKQRRDDVHLIIHGRDRSDLIRFT